MAVSEGMQIVFGDGLTVLALPSLSDLDIKICRLSNLARKPKLAGFENQWRIFIFLLIVYRLRKSGTNSCWILTCASLNAIRDGGNYRLGLVHTPVSRIQRGG